MSKIEVYNPGTIGVIKDVPAQFIPTDGWSDSRNMRFQDGVARKITGDVEVFGTPSVIPYFMLPVPVISSTFWIYASLTKAYVYEGGVHTNITRQSAGVDVDYTTVNYRDWNGSVIGGLPVLNNGADIPQYWSTASAGTKLANLTNWPSTLRAKILRSFGPFLVALNINDNGVLYPHMVWWSHPTDPGALPVSWDYSDPVYDAGRRELTDVEGGRIIDALMLRNMLIIYKETSTHYMRYVGGQEIMATDLLFAGAGALTARCATLIKKGTAHFVATADDLITHNGQTLESVLDRKAKKFLANDLDPVNYRNSFCCDNTANQEAWFCYPSSGSTDPNKVLIWNYYENTIQFRDFTGVYATSSSAIDAQNIPWSSLTNTWDTTTDRWSEEGKRWLIAADTVNTKFRRLDVTETFNGGIFNSFIERTHLAIMSKDRKGNERPDYTTQKLCKRIWPKIVGDSPVLVRVGGMETHDSNVVWNAPQTFIPGAMKYLDVTVVGRLFAVRFETFTDQTWQLEGYDLDIEIIGEH